MFPLFPLFPLFREYILYKGVLRVLCQLNG